MNEAEVVEQLVNFTNILLAGVSVLFTVVSAYIAALNYFIGSAQLIARLFAFAFVSLILGMLIFVMLGAQYTQQGLIERLHEIEQTQGLSAAGRALLANAAAQTGPSAASIDDIVRTCVWAGFGVIFLSLAYLTFFHRWRPEIIPVAIESSKRTD